MSSAWKDLERTVAKELGGQRILRGDDFRRSDVDVLVEDFPHFKIDCKHRKGSWKHHSLLKEIKRKYCTSEYQVPVLVTKCRGEHGECVTVPLQAFKALLNALRVIRDEGPK